MEGQTTTQGRTKWKAIIPKPLKGCTDTFSKNHKIKKGSGEHGKWTTSQNELKKRKKTDQISANFSSSSTTIFETYH